MIFAFNVALSLFIDDKPKSVKAEESARKYAFKRAKKDIETYKTNRTLQSLRDYTNHVMDMTKEIEKEERRQEKLELEKQKQKVIDPHQNAKLAKKMLRDRRFNVEDVQNVSIERQKIINKYNNEKKRFLRNKEKAKFQKIMLSRLDDDEENDLSFQMDSSVESIDNDKVFDKFREQEVKT